MLRRIANNTNVFFSTGMIGYIILFLVLYQIIAGLWTVIYLFILPSGAMDPKYASSVSILNIIVGFVYFIYLRESMEGFTAGVEQCDRLLCQISTMCTRIFDNLHIHRQLIHDGKNNNYSTLEIRDCSILILHMVYCVFNPSIYIKFGDTAYIFPDNLPPIKHNDIFNYYLSIKNTYHFTPTQKVRMMIQYLYKMIILCEKKGLIMKGYHISTMDRHLDPIFDTLMLLDTSMKTTTPDFIRQHNFFILFIWFIIWLPYNILVTAGWETLMGIYTLLMFAFTGSMIISKTQSGSYSFGLNVNGTYPGCNPKPDL